MPFVGELKYERLKDEESFVGRPVYRLTEEFVYRKQKKDGLANVVCEKGFETDFASIPEWIFFLRPRNGKWAKSSVIHDRLCRWASEGIVPYKYADDIFYYAMREDEASWFTAMFMYFWVRLNHLITLKG